MKKTPLIITLAAVLCAFASCGGTSSYNTSAMLTDNAGSEKTETVTADLNENGEDTSPDAEAVTAAEEITSDGDTIQTETENAAQNETGPFAGTDFQRGTVTGNVYTSEYAGFKFTAPEGVEFADEEHIELANTAPLQFMSEEEKEFFKTGFLDASVRYTDFGGDVSIWYIDTKLRYPDKPDISAYDFIQKEFFESDYEIRPKDMEGPEEVILGGIDFMKLSWTSLDHPYCMYVRRISDDFIVKIDAAEETIDDIESRITAID